MSACSTVWVLVLCALVLHTRSVYALRPLQKPCLCPFRGFRKIGGPIWMSALAVPIIHLTFAYWTQDSWIPSPSLGIYTKNIHRVSSITACHAERLLLGVPGHYCCGPIYLLAAGSKFAATAHGE